MSVDADRRRCLGAAVAGALATRAVIAAPPSNAQPWRIFAITFRGRTDVEQGFEDYFAARRIPVQISYRDMNRDPGRMPGFLDEIRATRPDLVYTWGTSVTLAVVGPYDGVIEGRHITDIPVVFTLVAAPLQAQILVDKRAPATLPVQSLQRFSYQISMAAARRLQLPPPLPMFNYAELIGEPGAGR